MPRDDLLIAEMIDAARRIIELGAEGDAESLASHRDRLDALLWNFTVLGEAASQVSVALKDTNQEIEWSDPVRMRNRVVHGYWSVELDVLITTAQEDLPQLMRQLVSLAIEPGDS